jgi:electron transfer flavoprotein beta subunit
MKILVCIKQVAEPEAELHRDPDGCRVIAASGTRYRLNRFDAHALETAISIKEEVAGVQVEVISVGPGRAGEALRRCLGMGADHGIHIVSSGQGPPSPFTVASWISEVAGSRGYDLLLAGVMSEDDLQGLVGPLAAEMLMLPCVSGVTHLDYDADRYRAVVKREMGGGRSERLEVKLPAAVTVQSSAAPPRYPSLSNLLRAERGHLEVIDASRCAPAAPRQEIVRLTLPPKTRAAAVIEGKLESKAARLWALLHKKALLAASAPPA